MLPSSAWQRLTVGVPNVAPLLGGCATLLSSAGLQHVIQADPLCLRRCIWSDKDSPGAAADPLENFYDNTVERYALQPIEQLTLRQMLHFGRDINNRPDKLPKRLARRLLDLQFLPYIVVSNPHIRRVYHAYYHAFNVIRNVPEITSWEANIEFTQMLRRLVDEHAPMLDALASGLRECSSKPLVGEQIKLDGFLDNMLRSRISRRVLAEQHVNLQNTMPSHVGCFDMDLDLVEAADFAAQRVRQVCAETYGHAPVVRVAGDARARLTYIPAHLDYMLYELLKNAARAVVERHEGRGSGALPPIAMHVCGADEFVTIRIMDQGGGIPEAELQRVWQYGYTTTTTATNDPGGGEGSEGLGRDFGGMWSHVGKYSAGAARYRMAGLGFGLPLSRLYARYFDGDLKLISVPGYGVDAHLQIKRLEREDWVEGGSEVAEPPHAPDAS